MAFTDNANDLYNVVWAGLPVQITVKSGSTIKKGQLVGYNSGWVLADDSNGYRATYVALTDGAAGETIAASPVAIVDGISGATANGVVYLDEDGGYDDDIGTVTGQIVGRCVSATEMFIDLVPWQALTNGSVAADAAIAWSKMAALTSNYVLAGVSGVATVCNVAGDISMTAASTTATFAIASDSIINADVKSDAAIAWSKMAALTSNYILAGVSSVATVCSVAGDLTMTASGTAATFAIASGVIIDADVKSDAAIAYSKLAALTSNYILAGVSNVATVCSVAGDLTMTAASTTATFAIATDCIIDADVKSNAAIAWSKMAALTTNYVLAGVSNVATVCDVAGDLTMTASGTTATFLVGAGKLDAENVATTANVNVVGGIPFIYRIAVPDATGNTDVTVTYKSRVLDFWIVNTGAAAHATDDKIQLKNGTDNITDVLAKTATQLKVVRASTIDNTYSEIAAGGTLRIAATKDTNVACVAYVLCVKVA